MSDYMQTFPLLKIIDHGPDVRSLYFEQAFDVQPGQFVNLWIPGLDEKPFSVSAIVDGMIELSIKAYGPFSRAVMELRSGQRLGIRGPFGHGFSLHHNALLIGGGIGIAPLRILSHVLKEKGKRFTSLLGAATDFEIIFAEDFENNSNCYFMTDDGSKGGRGLVTDHLLDIIKKEKIEFIYAAGPEIMFVKVKKLIDSLDIPYEFCLERYMKCGIGICGQCCVDGSGVRLCVEGPVLNRDAVNEITELGMIHRDASGRRVVHEP